MMAKAVGVGVIVAGDIPGDRHNRAPELGTTHAVKSQECIVGEKARNLSDGAVTWFLKLSVSRQPSNKT